MACSSWEAGEVEIGFMGRMEDNARWGMDGNGVGSWTFVAHQSGGREKMCRATGVSNGIERGGGRTGGMITLV